MMSSATPGSASRPRHLVVITVDEMRGDCLGANELNPDIRTPHMDHLAARGVNLTRHFTCFPKCVPARISMMTGRYAHTDGFRTIQQHLPADRPNVLKTLLDLGFETAVFGLNHVWEHLFEASHTPPTLAAGQQGLRIDHHSWTAAFRDIYDDCQADAPDPAIWRDRVDLDRPLTSDTDYRGDVDWHWSSEAVTRQAIRMLTEVRDPDRRLYLQVNLSPPHPPYAAPQPWYARYDPDSIEPFPHDLPKGAPLSLRAQREHRTGLHPDAGLLRRMQAVYYAMIERVDEQVGRIVQAIEDQGLLGDTVVLFASDHGDFAGQYGLPEKWDTTFSDCLTHVPCVIAGGGLPSGRCVASLTEHTDLAVTLLGLLGLEPDWHIHGGDLRPLLSGEIDAVRDAVFAEGGHEAAMRDRFDGTPRQDGKQRTYQQCPEAMARARMVRTADHKLVVRETGDHELYDLTTDRWEMNNRFGDPALAAAQAELMERLLRWCLQTDPDRPHQNLVSA
ncbi:MAG: sulfatase-like hydrolase/transferase [Planctomycetota bacterium]